jgi:uncharacterized protein YeaO (DUF488 family)
VLISLLSAYQISAEEFFEKINLAKADLVLDVRLSNKNQLAGFTKEDTLAYLVPRLSKASYIYDPFFAPEKGLLSDYLAGKIDFAQFSKSYLKALDQKGGKQIFKERYSSYNSIVLIGAMTKKRHSHVEALKAYLEEK